jgi:hypothetical protein
MFRSPLFAWSPRPGQDRNQDPFGTPASQSSSRFGALHSNIRGMINGSSIYSQSPALEQNNKTPKTPFLGFFRRDQAFDPESSPVARDGPRASDDSRSPLRGHHTAGSYIGAIESQAPQSPENVYHRHPADVALPRQDSDNVDPEDQQPAERRHRRKHRRRKHRQPQAAQWVRRREERGAHGPMLFIRGSPARGKMIACIISGSFLLTVLSVCKST